MTDAPRTTSGLLAVVVLAPAAAGALAVGTGWALANPPREQKTRVYAIKGPIRYCRCDNCGHTWKKIMEVKSAE